MLVFLINLIFSFYYILIILRIILSFIPHNQYQPGIFFVYKLTEPLLGVLRRGISPAGLGVDFSPAVAIILLWVGQNILIKLLGIIF